MVLYKLFDTGYYPREQLPSAQNIAQSQAGAVKDQTQHKPSGDLATEISKGPRTKAAFITLARNSDIWEIADSIKQVEDRFNRKFHYDWVFLNDKPFDDLFKRTASNLVSGKAKFGLIPKEHWSFPDWIDQERAAKTRKEMVSTSR